MSGGRGRQRREPGLGGLLAGRATRRLQIPAERIERGVALARRFGDEVPFGGGDGVGGRAATRRQNPGKAVLRDGAALTRRPAEPDDRACLVLGYSGAVEQRD